MSQTDEKTVSVRISGKKGKTTIKVTAGATATDAILEAAAILGLPNFTLEGSTVVIDGETAAADAPIETATKIDVTPKASLG